MTDYTLGWEASLIMVAAGAIMGIRVGVSLLLGAIVYYGILGPIAVEQGWAKAGYRGIVSWTLWPATAMMLASSLLAFALRWRTVLRSFSGLAALVGHRRTPTIRSRRSKFRPVGSSLARSLPALPASDWAISFSTFPGGRASWPCCLTFLLSTVAARATGETDITPIGAMGKITQLTFGVMLRNNSTANLMAASITAGASAHSADLLTDLKSGYLLGGNPRQQTISQLFGVLAGTLVCVPVYAIVVTPEKLGSSELPAPSAKVWAGGGRNVRQRARRLAAPHRQSHCRSVRLVGIVLTLLEEFAPPRYRRWIPSPTGLGNCRRDAGVQFVVDVRRRRDCLDRGSLRSQGRRKIYDPRLQRVDCRRIADGGYRSADRRGCQNGCTLVPIRLTAVASLAQLAPAEGVTCTIFTLRFMLGPTIASRVRRLTFAGSSFATCTISPEWLGRSTLARSFEEVAADLARLERMYIEPDGSFVWVSSRREAPWQVDGNLYDHQERVRLVDVKGSCPAERFDQLLAALGWPRTPLVFQLVRAAVFLDEAEFRRWALLQRGEA